MKTYLVIIGFCLTVIIPLQAQTAREIMEKVDQISRSTNNSSFTVMKLSTCKFGVSNRKIKCLEKPRVKKLESVQLNTGKDEMDSKAISIILEPAGERGIGMLSYTYDEVGKDSESWIYLSALGKVKRMASGADDDAEPTSLFGSEFTTEDMETGKLKEYTYKILKESKIGKRPVWIIESTPTPARLKKTRYSKTTVWIDKERYLALKVQTYDKRGKAYKKLSFFKVQQIKNRWMARSIIIMNIQTKRLTKMSLDKIALDVSVKENFFSQRSLTDFAFREHNLSNLRKQME